MPKLRALSIRAWAISPECSMPSCRLNTNPAGLRKPKSAGVSFGTEKVSFSPAYIAQGTVHFRQLVGVAGMFRRVG